MPTLSKILLFTPASKFKSKILNFFGFSFLPTVFYLFTKITQKIKKKNTLIELT